MNRNLLYVIIAILVIVVGILGWQYYQDQQTSTLELNMDDSGVSVEAE